MAATRREDSNMASSNVGDTSSGGALSDGLHGNNNKKRKNDGNNNDVETKNDNNINTNSGNSSGGVPLSSISLVDAATRGVIQAIAHRELARCKNNVYRNDRAQHSSPLARVANSSKQSMNQSAV